MHLLSGTVFWDTGVSMTERKQWSCTSDRGQQSVWDKPPAIVTIYCCQSIKNKTHALAYTKLVPGSNWNTLVCSVYKHLGEQTELQRFFFFSSKGYLINCFVGEAVSSYVPCAVVCLVDSIRLFVWPRARPLWGCILPLDWNTFCTFEIPQDLLSSRV